MSQSNRVVSIGDVSVQAKDDPSHLVPVTPWLDGLSCKEPSQSELGALRWMMQKALLKQDMFLLGPAGPLLRHLAFRFCEVLGREMEYVGITQDTGEADLKQRCEISDGSIEYVDQPPVKAAIHGRVLVLEGIEKAERNVLPLLNNLLENREMSLEDRRFLLSPNRAAELVQQLQGDELAKLVPVHEDFLVIALGSPDRGNPLDPPLRSRFAALQLRQMPSELLQPLAALAPSLPLSEIERLLLATSLLQPSGMSTTALGSVVKLLAMLPGLNSWDLLKRACPAAAGLVPQIEKLCIDKALESLRQQNMTRNTSYSVVGVRLLDAKDDTMTAVLQFQKTLSAKFTKDVVELLVPCGSFVSEVHLPDDHGDEEDFELDRMSAKQLRCWLKDQGVSDSGCLERSDFLVRAKDHLKKLGEQSFPPPGILSRPIGCVSLTRSQASILSQVIMDHAAGSDIALIGDKGSGKSTLVKAFASILGYRTRNIFCYRDMSSRDLLQHRTTDPWGNTAWTDSPLVQAAIHGDLAVLDGIHRLAKGTLYGALAPLLADRWCSLPDGTLLFSASQWSTLMDRGEEVKAALLVSGARKVSPAFRVIACGDLPEPSSKPSMSGNWIDDEVSTLFNFHVLRDLPFPELRKLVETAASSNAENEEKQRICKLLSFSQAVKAACKDPDLKPLQLSLRALLRTAKHLASQNDLAGALDRAFSARFKFLEAFQRAKGEKLLAEAGIEALETTARSVELSSKQLDFLRRSPARPELVPKVQFVQIAKHLAVLQNMLASWSAGQHLLLVGNQGVGKNKLADHMLSLLCCEREYVQLHRDTTLQSLTVMPTLQAGVVSWRDSALLRAAKAGRCVVVDEADKAPLEVVCILKALAEDGVLTLPDGRTLVRHDDPRLSFPADRDELIPVAEGFRMIVLANRPGRPFLGNDFYRVCGDVFDCHVVEYLDTASELELLRSVAPAVPEGQLVTFSELFRELRQREDGEMVYPYSTRELVKMVSHAQRFPGDSFEYLAADVFSFDAFEERQKLLQALRHLGFAKGKDGEAALFGENRGNRNLHLGEKRETL